MTFLKSLRRKLFKQSAGVYSQGISVTQSVASTVEEVSKCYCNPHFDCHYCSSSLYSSIVYDPSLDEEKILKGEVESYFDS